MRPAWALTRRRRASRVNALRLVAVTVLAGASLGAFGPGPNRVGADPAGDVVARSVRATAEVDFRGAVHLSWYGPNAAPAEVDVPVRASGGRVTVGDETAGAAPGDVTNRAVTTWFHSLEQGPPAGAKYELRTVGTDEVAGRRVDVVEFRRSGQLVEKLWADKETGLALRRETLGEHGTPVRAMAFTRVDITTVGRPVTAVAVAPNLRPVPGQRAPRSLPNGYQLADITSRDGVTQAVYSDGLRSLSVFEQRGALDGVSRVRVPAVAQPVGAQEGRKYGWAGGTMVVWTDGRTTTAVVGDGPEREVVAAADAIPPRHLSALERLAEAGRHIVDLLA